jgi:protein CWC15
LIFFSFSDPLDESSSDEETTSSRHQSKFNKNTQQNRTINNEEEEEDDDENDDEEDDDEDDTAELMAELARIKKERAAEAARIEQQKRIEEEKIRTENILKGNPLLNPSSKASAQPSTSEFRVKRRWDDDVVFKNCAKSDSLTGEKRVAQFVNDSLRSDFHRRFMDKYIK